MLICTVFTTTQLSHYTAGTVPLPSALDIGSYLLLCFSLFPDCCVSLIRYPFLFLLQLDGSNRFSGHLQQDCLCTFPGIFWGVLILCSLECRKPVGHLCCKLYCFVFLEFLEIQRRNVVLSLSLSQPDLQHRHKQLMICVAVCSRICATIHQACFPSVRN